MLLLPPVRRAWSCVLLDRALESFGTDVATVAKVFILLSCGSAPHVRRKVLILVLCEARLFVASLIHRIGLIVNKQVSQTML